uniref:Putative ovule protein n=1 Tax=Solanum chacoense TaxID=4108 RepID=A0A0V0I063_SOLCH
MHEPHIPGEKLRQTGHRTSIFDDFLGVFCVNPISVGICVAPFHLFDNYFFIFNLSSAVPSFR